MLVIIGITSFDGRPDSHILRRIFRRSLTTYIVDQHHGKHREEDGSSVWRRMINPPRLTFELVPTSRVFSPWSEHGACGPARLESAPTHIHVLQHRWPSCIKRFSAALRNRQWERDWKRKNGTKNFWWVDDVDACLTKDGWTDELGEIEPGWETDGDRKLTRFVFEFWFIPFWRFNKLPTHAHKHTFSVFWSCAYISEFSDIWIGILDLLPQQKKKNNNNIPSDWRRANSNLFALFIRLCLWWPFFHLFQTDTAYLLPDEFE